MHASFIYVVNEKQPIKHIMELAQKLQQPKEQFANMVTDSDFLVGQSATQFAGQVPTVKTVNSYGHIDLSQHVLYII